MEHFFLHLLNKNAPFSSPSSPDSYHPTCCLYESDSTKVPCIGGITLCWSFCVCLFHLAKVCIVKAIVFPVVMYRCERWTIKKAEHQRTDAFELWCWRRLVGSPLDRKEIKPVSPKGIQPQIFIRSTDAEARILWPPDVKEEPPHWKRPWCCGRLRAGGEGGNRGWDSWRASLTQWTGVWANYGR